MAFELFQISSKDQILSQVWVDTDNRDDYESAQLLNMMYDRAVLRAGNVACSEQLSVELVLTDDANAEAAVV